MQQVIPRASVEMVIAVAAAQVVVALAALQQIIEPATKHRIVTRQRINPVHHVPEASQPVRSSRRTTHHRAVPQLNISPAASIRELELLNPVRLRRKIVLHPQTVRAAIVHIQLRAMALHQPYI